MDIGPYRSYRAVIEQGVGMRVWLLSGCVFLSGCGIPSDPTNGPVVLKCDGKVGYGEAPKNAEDETRFYRIDGTKQTFETWDSNNQKWLGSAGTPSITATEILHVTDGAVVSPFIKTYAFNRSKGTVLETFVSKEAAMRFDGKCDPVKDPMSAPKKF